VRHCISKPKQVRLHLSFDFTQFSVSMMQGSRSTVLKPTVKLRSPNLVRVLKIMQMSTSNCIEIFAILLLQSIRSYAQNGDDFVFRLTSVCLIEVTIGNKLSSTVTLTVDLFISKLHHQLLASRGNLFAKF